METITSNLNASDEEYFNDCIDKLTHDEEQIENLLKIISTSVIKFFNSSIPKL